MSGRRERRTHQVDNVAFRVEAMPVLAIVGALRVQRRQRNAARDAAEAARSRRCGRGARRHGECVVTGEW